VFHLAAQIDVRRAVADPAFDASVNVGGTINVLEAARRATVARVVNSSTGGAIYGDAPVIPTAEDTTPAPMAPYGQSKHAAEGYCGLYHRLHGLSTVSLRYANIYGPRQDPHGEGGVIAIFCGKLVEGGRPVAFGDGLQTRDYTYVDDIVAANLAAAASDFHGACNIGTGVETTVVDLAAALRDLDGSHPFELEHAPERPGEIHRSAVDPSLARDALGWEARVQLADGLRRTLASLRG
jgi:UDP-glucose 4-epimerase